MFSFLGVTLIDIVFSALNMVIQLAMYQQHIDLGRATL
jgi:hypothetical protein